MKKFSRRDFGRLAGAGAVLAKAAEAGQKLTIVDQASAAYLTPAPSQTPTGLSGANTDWYAQSLADKRATAETLGRFSIDISTEPAFHFKP